MRSWCENEKLLGATVVGALHIFMGFTYRNPIRSSWWRSKKNSLVFLARGGENQSHIWNIPIAFAIIKAYQTGEKTLWESYPTWGKASYPTPAPCGLHVSSKEEGEIKKKKASGGHSPGTQAHWKTEVELQDYRPEHFPFPTPYTTSIRLYYNNSGLQLKEHQDIT